MSNSNFIFLKKKRGWKSVSVSESVSSIGGIPLKACVVQWGLIVVVYPVFLDASLHLYMSSCPSVRWIVRPSVHPSVYPVFLSVLSVHSWIISPVNVLECAGVFHHFLAMGPRPRHRWCEYKRNPTTRTDPSRPASEIPQMWCVGGCGHARRWSH